ncbi:type II secretion system F family protein [archaeon]|jgi:archaeal flagellar protein FlaJ|nr:type II secretion system F family protein [archaeon]MBT4352602.1 type II secretion system F family protein [archaeon]MBT4648233.1 type II secretion system F family protein [archaeon]MBT6822283.1 type II secretion system F family protein [archaeon]MBT7392657.1 type II secretion system F family protein [archaeon]
MNIVHIIASKNKGLRLQLRQANMLYTPEEFIKRTMVSAFYMAFMVIFIIFLLMAKSAEKMTVALTLIIAFPICIIFMYFYFMQLPMVKINRLNREISKEIVFAGRFMIIELESGVSLFKTLENIGASYKAVGAYFREIIEKVKIGTSLEQAVNEAVELVPSDPLRKILWQVANSLRTGSNVSRPLENVVETIIREQKIETNEYGRKLNPLAMFYMMMAIIVPSLGTTMLTIISIFAGLRISMPFLIAIVVVNGFIQFMFVAIISSSRPAVEL